MTAFLSGPRSYCEKFGYNTTFNLRQQFRPSATSAVCRTDTVGSATRYPNAYRAAHSPEAARLLTCLEVSTAVEMYAAVFSAGPLPEKREVLLNNVRDPLHLSRIQFCGMCRHTV